MCSSRVAGSIGANPPGHTRSMEPSAPPTWQAMDQPAPSECPQAMRSLSQAVPSRTSSMVPSPGPTQQQPSSQAASVTHTPHSAEATATSAYPQPTETPSAMRGIKTLTAGGSTGATQPVGMSYTGASARPTQIKVRTTDPLAYQLLRKPQQKMEPSRHSRTDPSPGPPAEAPLSITLESPTPTPKREDQPAPSGQAPDLKQH